MSVVFKLFRKTQGGGKHRGVENTGWWKTQGGGKHPFLPLIVTRLNDISLFYLLKIETKTLCVLQIDFALSVIFILHHLLRLLASSTILAFLLEMVTIVDYFTIPPLLASIWMGRTWIGLRYILYYTYSTIPLYGWDRTKVYTLLYLLY